MVVQLRAAGHDVRYAAESDKSVEDRRLLSIALAEKRIVVTEDFDFGELLIRDKLASIGAIIVHLPGMRPAGRAERLAAALSDGSLKFEGAITILEERRLRQRKLVD
jgi:hypothetical protein